MTDHRNDATDEPNRRPTHGGPRLQSALEQLREDALVYNEAVGSYNRHLDNHRERRDLQDVPFRAPVTGHDAFDPAIEGERAALETLLEDLLDGAHLDSELRRHPWVYPIHVEATEHLEIARDRLVSTLEDALRELDS